MTCTVNKLTLSSLIFVVNVVEVYLLRISYHRQGCLGAISMLLCCDCCIKEILVTICT